MARSFGDAGEGRGHRARLWRARRRATPDAGAPLGEGLRALLAAMGGTPGRAGLQSLWDNWEAALGEELAALARPLGHHEGRHTEKGATGSGEGGAVLLLGAGDAMLLQELRFRGEEILARVNGFLGQVYFSEVQVSLPLGRREPVRSRKQEKMAERADADTLGEGPSGIFLEAMDSASPVARCYARFARMREGKAAPEGEKAENIRKSMKYRDIS